MNTKIKQAKSSFSLNTKTVGPERFGFDIVNAIEQKNYNFVCLCSLQRDISLMIIYFQ